MAFLNRQPRPGDLSVRIKIRLWSDIPGAGVGTDQSFDAGVDAWAKHEPIHGLAIRAGKQTDEAPTDLFWVRARAGTADVDITTAHVVEWRGRRYRVVDSIGVGARQEFTRITAKDLGVIA